MSPPRNEIDEILALTDAIRVPTIFVTPDFVLRRMAPHIRYDNSHAGFIAADHLLQRGYRAIMFFAPYAAQWADERLNGITEAVERAVTSDCVLRVSECDPSLNTGLIDQEQVAYEYAVKLFEPAAALATEPPWGIVAVNDHAAWGLLRAANEMELTAGVDYALISFDDLPHSRDLGLTSLRPPYDQMGVEAGKMIRQALRGERMTMEVTLRSNIVARKSSMPPK